MTVHEVGSYEATAETRPRDLLGELPIVDAGPAEPDGCPQARERPAEAQQADGMVPNGPARSPAESARAFRNHHPALVAAAPGTLTVSRAPAVAS
ncbi:DUF6895 family protein [Kitasatospora sp. NPDC058965]|uniref:DUF6895 family protein n=1 Tax=Kitasatospora sp. NPDC058965 TaxID=3346682 RepID=UPI003690CCD5